MSSRELSATVAALLVTRSADSLIAEPAPSLKASQWGLQGDQRHRGVMALSGGRRPFFRRGTLLVQHRHCTVIDRPSLEHIADYLELPDDQAVSNLIDRTPQLHGLATAHSLGSRLLFLASVMSQNVVVDFVGNEAYPTLHDLPNGTVFGVRDEEYKSAGAAFGMLYNPPCKVPGAALGEILYPDDPETAQRMVSTFIKGSLACRGFVGPVERPGTMHVGDLIGFELQPTAEAFRALAAQEQTNNEPV